MAIASFSLVVLDCDDAQELADFYGAILGWQHYAPFDQGAWLQLRSSSGAAIAFQEIPDYQMPSWPGGDHPQQLHLDLDVPDLDEAEIEILKLGARKHSVQPNPVNFRVFLDPAGHPFCLVREGSVPG